MHFVHKLLPKSSARVLKKYFYSLVPLRWRLGKEYFGLKAFLQEAQWWEREKIEKWQLSKAQKIIDYAYTNVPGYYFLFNDAGILPEDIRSLDDIVKLPFTTKELIRDNLSDFTARNISEWNMRYVSTSGSTGIPFGFYQTNLNLWKEKAFMHSGWERVGWSLGDSTAVLRGGFVGSQENISNYLPGSKELLLSSYYLTEDNYSSYKEAFKIHQPKHLMAYPSSASLLANLIIENGDFGSIDFDIVFLASEKIFNYQIDVLHKAFKKAKLFSWYGHSEQVILAPWCEGEKTYHAWPFYGITEVVNTDEGVFLEEGQGEIVGTSFWNFATPFIRYKTMDYALRGKNYCESCGRNFLVLQNIGGRLGDLLLTEKGRNIPIPSTSIHGDIFKNVRQFQFKQDTPGHVLLCIIRKDQYSDRDSQKIYKSVKEKLGEDMALELVYVDHIKKSEQGKLRVVDKNIG